MWVDLVIVAYFRAGRALITFAYPVIAVSMSLMNYESVIITAYCPALLCPASFQIFLLALPPIPALSAFVLPCFIAICCPVSRLLLSDCCFQASFSRIIAGDSKYVLVICLLFRRHAMGSFAFYSASCHGFFAFILASCHGFTAFYSSFTPWVHCHFIWLHCHGIVANLIAFWHPNPFAFWHSPIYLPFWHPICLLAPHLPFGAPFHQMCNNNTYDKKSSYFALHHHPHFFLNPMTICPAAKRGPGIYSRVKFVNEFKFMSKDDQAFQHTSDSFLPRARAW